MTNAAFAANTEASSRAQRTRRRLYQMALSIITPYVPLQMAFFVINLTRTLGDLAVYDYQAIHSAIDPPWRAIIFLPSWMMDFAILNQPWVAIVTTIPIVLFFGMTKEAIDIYRTFLIYLGFGTCLPSLKEPYGPDRPRSTGTSRKTWWSSSKNMKPAVDET